MHGVKRHGKWLDEDGAIRFRPVGDQDAIRAGDDHVFGHPTVDTHPQLGMPGAPISMATQALMTFAARDQWPGRDARSHCYASVGARPLHDTDDLMTEHHRSGPTGDRVGIHRHRDWTTPDFFDVSPADPDRFDAKEDLARSGFWQRDLVESNVAPRVPSQCFHHLVAIPCSAMEQLNPA
jgi:hypothetical protein